MLQVYTGDGKGKTFAATGLALRASSRRLRVLFAEFMKETPQGSTSSLKDLEGIELIAFPLLSSTPEDAEGSPDELNKSARDALLQLGEAMNGRDLVILDGFCSLLRPGVLSEEEAREFIASRPDGVEMVLTGRGAPGWLIEMADLVTEMEDLKHPAA